jgi:MFS transporter, NNP family, nitrate/nitrite transporter
MGRLGVSLSLSYPNTELTVHTIDGSLQFGIALPAGLFALLLFALGIAFACGMSSTFKYIGDDFPDAMGAISGIVKMAGGLAGFLLPIMFGMILDQFRFNSSCFMLLYGIVAVSLMLNYLTEVRRVPVMGEMLAPTAHASEARRS